jgi:hypothetical protein
VIADRGYDSDPLRQRLRRRGIELIVPYQENNQHRRYEACVYRNETINNLRLAAALVRLMVKTIVAVVRRDPVEIIALAGVIAGRVVTRIFGCLDQTWAGKRKGRKRKVGARTEDPSPAVERDFASPRARPEGTG